MLKEHFSEVAAYLFEIGEADSGRLSSEFEMADLAFELPPASIPVKTAAKASCPKSFADTTTSSIGIKL